MNQTIIRTLTKKGTSSSFVKDITFLISEVYGRNIVMVSASDVANKSTHWATSSVTCGENPQEVLMTDSWDEYQSNGCPAYVTGEVQELSAKIAQFLYPKMGASYIRDVCLSVIDFPCAVKIESKTETIFIEFRHEATK